MTIAAELAGKYSGMFLLDPNDLPGIAHYLQKHEWIEPQEIIHRAERAGEGNMIRLMLNRIALV